MVRSHDSIPGSVWVSWILVLAAALHAAAAEDVDALRKEVSSKGWIVFAGHPAEIDGGKIIATAEERGPTDLFVCRPDGSELRNLTRTADRSEYGARLSPDGNKMLFRRLPADAAVNHDQWGMFGELVIADADGGHAEVQGKPGELPWATWSPDGKLLACLYRKEGAIRLLDAGTRRLVKELPARGIFQQIFWSADGKRLVGTANLAGRDWNILAIEVDSGKPTQLSRQLACTPDWFQKDPGRAIYSNRLPGLTNRLGRETDGYGFTVLMQATADGKKRDLIYGRLGRHVYFGCTSPDDAYVVFSDEPEDTIVVGEMRVMRLSDAPVISRDPPFPELEERYPGSRPGPVLDLKQPSGAPLRGFEPQWIAEESGK